MSSCDDKGDADKAGKGSLPPTSEGEVSYEVGNKKPPKASQFKPGQSGNPKGRPKGSISFEAKVQNELSKPITVTKNGKSVKMSKLDVGVMRLVDRFMGGDLKSIAIILGLGKKNEKATSIDETADTLVVPDEANLEFIFERLRGIVKGGTGGPSDE